MPDDPAMVKTRNGSLVVTLDNRPSHDLNFTGGQLTSWNKFCFTGGRIEASVRLPGRPDVMGLWPAVWTLGNLGRIGRGAFYFPFLLVSSRTMGRTRALTNGSCALLSLALRWNARWSMAVLIRCLRVSLSFFLPPPSISDPSAPSLRSAGSERPSSSLILALNLTQMASSSQESDFEWSVELTLSLAALC